MVAIGSQNGSVYLFRVSRDGYSYKKSNKIRGSQPLTQLDWSSDGNYLQTVTADYDLAFCKYTVERIKLPPNFKNKYILFPDFKYKKHFIKFKFNIYYNFQKHCYINNLYGIFFLYF